MSVFDTHQEETDDEEEEEEEEREPTEVDQRERNENDDLAFIAKLKSSRTLASILKTIHFADVSLIVR